MHEPTPEDVAAARELLDWALARLADRRGTLPPADPTCTLPPIRPEGIGTEAALDALLARGVPDHRAAGPPALPRVHPGHADGGRGARRHGALGGHGLRRQPPGGRSPPWTPKRPRFAGSPTRPASPPTAGGTFVSGGSIANLERPRRGARRPVRLAAAARSSSPAHSAHSSLAAAARVHGLRPLRRAAGRRARPPRRAPRSTTRARGPRPARTWSPSWPPPAPPTTAPWTTSPASPTCARTRGIWLHVDGAYGGAALLSPRTRGLFAGIERADSFIVNPHKWLYLPFDCAAVVYRDGAAARQALTQEADYLDAIADEEAGNPSDLAVHLTRRARGLPLWASVLAYGTDAYVAGHRALPRHRPRTPAERIAASPRLELVLEPSLTRGRLPPPRLEAPDYDAWSAGRPAQRPRHGHADQAPRRDRAAPLLHQSADHQGRRRPGRSTIWSDGEPRSCSVTDEPLVAVTMVMGTFAADTVKGALEAAGPRHDPRQHGDWPVAGPAAGSASSRCWSRPTAWTKRERSAGSGVVRRRRRGRRRRRRRGTQAKQRADPASRRVARYRASTELRTTGQARRGSSERSAPAEPTPEVECAPVAAGDGPVTVVQPARRSREVTSHGVS